MRGFYAKHWRWLETWDRQFEHMTPIQGDWKIRHWFAAGGVAKNLFRQRPQTACGRLPLPRLMAKRIVVRTRRSRHRRCRLAIARAYESPAVNKPEIAPATRLVHGVLDRLASRSAPGEAPRSSTAAARYGVEPNDHIPLHANTKWQLRLGEKLDVAPGHTRTEAAMRHELGTVASRRRRTSTANEKSGRRKCASRSSH